MMSDNNGKGSVVGQIVVAIVIALLVGGSAPWWWKEVFPKEPQAPTQQPLSRDSCQSLQGKVLEIVALNAEGRMAPAGLTLDKHPDGSYTFSSTVNFTGEPADNIAGTCKDGRIEFTRRRPGVFVQRYSGDILGEGSTLTLKGKFSHSLGDEPSPQQFDWSAVVAH